MSRIVEVVAARLLEASLVPYLGPELLRAPPFPRGPRALAEWLAARTPVPPRLGLDLHAAAEHVAAAGERRSLVKLVREAFRRRAEPSPLHLLLAGLPSLPLVIHSWYDPTFFEVLTESAARGEHRASLLAGVPPREAPGGFFVRLGADGAPDERREASVRVYHPHGAVRPVPAFLATEADYSDVLVGLETQTPIPPEVQELRGGRGFLFVGCRFAGVIERIFARQIMRSSAGPHFAILPEEPSATELRFLAAEGITRIPLSVELFVAELSRRLARYAREAAVLSALPGPGGA